MMQFPITELLDEEECYPYLQRTLHPDGLGCPSGHRLAKGQAPHERKRPPGGEISLSAGECGGGRACIARGLRRRCSTWCGSMTRPTSSRC